MKAVNVLLAVLCVSPAAYAGPLYIAQLANSSVSADAVHILIHRAENLALKQQVWHAVYEMAATRGVRLPHSLRAEDIQWAAPSALLADGSPLEVQSVSVDRLLNQLRFRLRFLLHPEAPSFYAWCPLPEAHMATSNGADSASTAASRRSDAMALVSVRRQATLQLHSQNSSAVLRVRPLESGELGETVRVRVLGNGHTLVARIAGRDLLEAAF
jgi:hypothetical protein